MFFFLSDSFIHIWLTRNVHIGPPPSPGLELVECLRMRHRRGQNHDGRDGDGQFGVEGFRV